MSNKKGLWDNIHAKRERIAKGSGERMRKPGSEGAPTAKDLRVSQSKKEGGKIDLAHCKMSTASTKSKNTNY
jgi:hypothetical protein